MFDKTTVEYSKSAKLVVKEWLKKDEYSTFNLKNFEEILELIGIKDTVKIDLVEKAENTINCITREGESYIVKLVQNDEVYLVNLQVAVNNKKGLNETFDIKTYQDKKLKTKTKVSLINVVQQNEDRIIKLSAKENREIGIYLKYKEKIGINISIYGEVVLTKEFKNYLLKYLSSMSIDLNFIDPKPVYEKIVEIVPKCECGNTKDLEIVIIYYDEENEKSNLAKIYMETNNIQMYGIAKGGKVFRVFRNGNWEYIDSKTRISYENQKEEYGLSVKVKQKEDFKNISVDNILEIEKQIKELFEYLFK